MSRTAILFLLVLVLLPQTSAVAQIRLAQRRTLRDALDHVTLKVDALDREYYLSVPENLETVAPLVFVFHGHGGTAIGVARSFAIQKHWPEAIVVYMQGIPTPGQLTDPEGKRNGWQHAASAEGDRDLKFFDAVLQEVQKKYQVDKTRIYSTGHSNGGGFTYLLWAERGEHFAAVAPSAAVAGRVVNTLAPKPVMHLAGEQDALVKYRWQELMMGSLLRINTCDPIGEEWSKHGTLYRSKNGGVVVTYIHPGTHQFPAEAPPLIVKFFKEHQKQKSDLPKQD